MSARRQAGEGPRGGRLLAVGLGVLITILFVSLTELVLRLVDPDLRVRRESAFPETVDHLRNLHHEPDRELLWRARPGYSAGGIRITETGFRAAPGEADPARYDVVCLGNSVTFGYTTPRYGDTYPARLEAALRAGCGAPLEVLDAGVIGYTSAQGRRLFESQIAGLGARVVTILYGYNDHHLSPSSDAEKLGTTSGARVPRALARLAVYRALRKVIAGLRPEEVRGTLVPRVGHDALRRNLSAIVESARMGGASPVLVTVPIRPRIPLVENPVSVTTPAGETRWMFQARWLTGKVPPDARGPLTRLLFANEPMPREPLVALAPTLERLAAVAPESWALPPFVLGLALEAAGDTARASAQFALAAAHDRERAVLESYNAVIRNLATEEGVPLVDVARALEDHPGAFSDVVHTNEVGNARIAELLAPAVARALGCTGD